jgi:hypothetical protein
VAYYSRVLPNIKQNQYFSHAQSKQLESHPYLKDKDALYQISKKHGPFARMQRVNLQISININWLHLGMANAYKQV